MSLPVQQGPSKRLVLELCSECLFFNIRSQGASRLLYDKSPLGLSFYLSLLKEKKKSVVNTAQAARNQGPEVSMETREGTENCSCSIPRNSSASSPAAHLPVLLSLTSVAWRGRSLESCTSKTDCSESHLQKPLEEQAKLLPDGRDLLFNVPEKLWSVKPELAGRGGEWGRSLYIIPCLFFIAQLRWQNSCSRRIHTQREYRVLQHIRQYVTVLKMLQKAEWPRGSGACWEAETGTLPAWEEMCSWCCSLHFRCCGDRCSQKPLTANVEAPAALTATLTRRGAACPVPRRYRQMYSALIMPDTHCKYFKGRGNEC